MSDQRGGIILLIISVNIGIMAGFDQAVFKMTVIGIKMNATWRTLC